MEKCNIKILSKQTVDRIKYELVSSTHFVDDCGTVSEYGFIVSDKSKKGCTNQAKMLFVTPDRLTAENIFTLLTENTVEPCHLEDVIYDIIII